MSWLHGRRNGKHASHGASAPRARTDMLVLEDVGDEVLVYDQRNDQAHCLSRDAAMVWRVCDGTSSPGEIAAALELEPETVMRAIEELDACALLDSAPIPGVTRREAALRMAKVGGAAAAVPLVYSIMAPTPALAASQAFCLSLTPTCFQGGSGCSTCYKQGCVCCGAGSSATSGTKLCTADCTCTNCNPCLIHNHCGVSGNDSTCTAGSTGLGNGKCTLQPGQSCCGNEICP